MRRRALLTAAAGLTLAAGCSGGRRPENDGRLVFARQPPWGDPAPFDALVAGFAGLHPEVELVARTIPNASDVAHQLYLTTLEGGSADIDLLLVDVVWVAELARAGWIADLSDALPPEVLRRDWLAGAAESAIVEGRTRSIPFTVDVGLLYRRIDLVPDPPRTHADLEEAARAARDRDPELHGFVWQGRQYEGLVCNAYEAIWGHGGATFAGDRLALATAAAETGLSWLRSLIERGLSPRSVTAMAEEDSRRSFQDGRAVFLRNWPYAWAESQRDGSPVAGKVGVSPLPSADGAGGFGALGGWHYAVNAHAPPRRRELAIALAQHMTSVDASIAMARAHGRCPPRQITWDDPRLVAGAPHLLPLRAALERARPRPVTPYYPMLTDGLQGELSAAVSGHRPVRESLARAQAFADRVMGALR